MVNRIVSTKLTEGEHSRLLEFCNDYGLTISSMLRQVILERIKNDEKERIQLLDDLKISRKSFDFQIQNQEFKKGSSQTTNTVLENDYNFLYF